MEIKFSRQIFENTQISNFTKIRPVAEELFRADGRTDGRTDMTKLIAAFRNFAHAPKTSSFRSRVYVLRAIQWQQPLFL